jgi:hypothetical protein
MTLICDWLSLTNEDWSTTRPRASSPGLLSWQPLQSFIGTLRELFRKCTHHKVLTFVEYRAVSGVFQNIDPQPSSPPSESVLPPAPKAGVHRTVRVVEGQYFGRRQT